MTDLNRASGLRATMGNMAMASKRNDSAERVLAATVQLLSREGPSAIKARAVATEAGLSTMAVYHHFGGIAELVQAVRDHGFAQLEAAFAATPQTTDPVRDLLMMALACRRLAGVSPHLYDVMFGLSARSTYRPLGEPDGSPSGHSPAFRRAYRHLVEGCRRLAQSGRVTTANPEMVAAQLWSMVHGFITLELGGHFAAFADPVNDVLCTMGVNFYVGLGDDRELAEASHRAARRSGLDGTSV